MGFFSTIFLFLLAIVALGTPLGWIALLLLVAKALFGFQMKGYKRRIPTPLVREPAVQLDHLYY